MSDSSLGERERENAECSAMHKHSDSIKGNQAKGTGDTDQTNQTNSFPHNVPFFQTINNGRLTHYTTNKNSWHENDKIYKKRIKYPRKTNRNEVARLLTALILEYKWANDTASLRSSALLPSLFQKQFLS